MIPWHCHSSNHHILGSAKSCRGQDIFWLQSIKQGVMENLTRLFFLASKLIQGALRGSPTRWRLYDIWSYRIVGDCCLVEICYKRILLLKANLAKKNVLLFRSISSIIDHYLGIFRQMITHTDSRPWYPSEHFHMIGVFIFDARGWISKNFIPQLFMTILNQSSYFFATSSPIRIPLWSKITRF